MENIRLNDIVIEVQGSRWEGVCPGCGKKFVYVDGKMPIHSKPAGMPFICGGK